MADFDEFEKCSRYWEEHRGLRGRAHSTGILAGVGASLIILANGGVAGAQPTQAAADIDEVIVTAQQRSQTAEQVPISMQVVGPEQIAATGATDLGNLQLFVPGLSVTGTPTQPHYSLRGINSNDFGTGTDPAVGIYVDGIYSGRSGSALTTFDDVEQIEILKGPQGTLLGRSSAAGAIIVTSNKPSDQFEGEISGRYASFDERRVAATLNIPLGDAFSFRVNNVYDARAGFVKDAATGADLGSTDEDSVKAALRWRPDEETDAILTFRHDSLDNMPTPGVNLAPLVPSPAISYLYPSLRPAYPVAVGALANPLTAPVANDVQDPHETRDMYEVTLSVTKDMGWATLTSLSDYRYFDTQNLLSQDGTNDPELYFASLNAEKNRQIYQELRLNHSNDTFDWVAGASYYREHADQDTVASLNTSSLDVAVFNAQGTAPFHTIDRLLSAAGLGSPYTAFENVPWSESTVNNGGRNQSYAAFGDVIWHAMDRLDLTAGLRFSRDDKSYTWDFPTRYSPGMDALVGKFGGPSGLDAVLAKVLAGSGLPAAVAAGTAASLVGATEGNIANAADVAYGRHFAASKGWDNMSPRLVAAYSFADRSNVYASFSEGYKPGGFNSEQAPTPNGALAAAYQFAPEKIRNYEIGIKTVLPDEHIKIDGSIYHYVYLNRQNTQYVVPCSNCIAEYVTQTESDQATGLDLNVQWTPVSGLHVGLDSSLIDATVMTPGQTFPGEIPVIAGKPTGEPILSFTASVSYIIPIESDALSFDLNQGYRGEGRCNNHTASLSVISSCNQPLQYDTLKAQATTNLRATYIHGNDDWRLSAFVNNLFDNRWTTAYGGVAVASLGTVKAEITPPRSLGVDLTVKF